MSFTTISKSNFDFLKELKKNNNRDWFTQNKKRFLKENEEMITFADALIEKVNKHDVLETLSGKKSLYRIYRDIRFSKDKTPYKSHWSGGFQRATKKRRGGYYFHIEPGNTMIGGGFYAPNPADLKRIRDEFSYDAAPIKKILNSKSFKATFNQLEGEKVKTTPKGFDANHPAIDLIRYKQFFLVRKFTDKEVLNPSFLNQVNDTFKKMRPFLDYMSEVLTTDKNGISIV